MELNMYLRFLRMAAGMTQSELARKMNCTKQNISKAEKTPRRISVDYLTKFATAMDKTPSALLAGYEKVRQTV